MQSFLCKDAESIGLLDGLAYIVCGIFLLNIEIKVHLVG